MSEATQPLIGKRALVHLGVFAALLLLVLVVPDRGDRVGMRELDLPDLDQERITSIEIGGKHQAKLEKKEGRWTVTAPSQEGGKAYPVEEDLIERALTAIAEIETGAFVTGRSEKHGELEIGEEKGTTLSVATDDHKTLELVIGRFAKGGGNYVRLKSADEVFVGEGSLGSAIRKSADQWRRKKIIDAAEEELVEVEVAVAGEQPYKLVRAPAAGEEGEPGPWQLADGTTLPAGFRLDDNALGRLPKAFATLRVTDYVDDKEPGRETGLIDGATRVTARTEGGKTITARFGKEDDKKRTYLTLAGDEQVYVVNSYTEKNVAKPLSDLRDLRLLPELDAGRVSAVLFEGSDSGRVKLAKGEDGTWTIAEGAPPEGKTFDPSTVTPKLGQLARLKGKDFVGQGPSAAFTPSRPSFKITLTVEGEDAPVVVEMSDVLPGEDGKPANEVAVRTSDGYVYELPKFQRDRWSKPWDQFKEVAPPPGGMPGGGIPGMENLPPDIRKQLEAQLKQGNFPGR